MIKYWDIPDEFSGKNEVVKVPIYFQDNKALNKINNASVVLMLAYDEFMKLIEKWYSKQHRMRRYDTRLSMDNLIQMVETAITTVQLRDIRYFDAWTMPVRKALTIHAKILYKWVKRRMKPEKLYSAQIPFYMTNSILLEPRSVFIYDDLESGSIRALGEFMLEYPTLLPSEKNMNRLRIIIEHNQFGFLGGKLYLCCESFVSLKGTILRPDLIHDDDYDTIDLADYFVKDPDGDDEEREYTDEEIEEMLEEARSHVN